MKQRLIISEIGLFVMGFLDNELPPGHETLRPCVDCGADAVYRTSKHWYSLTMQYYCDECGHEMSEKEVQKSFRESVGEATAEFAEETRKIKQDFNEDLEKIEQKKTSTTEKISPPGQSEIDDDELKAEVSNRQIEGWEIEEVNNDNNSVIMTTTEGGTIGGHALTGLLTGFWTFGAGNVAYSKLSKKKNSERVVLTGGDVQIDNEQVDNKVDVIEEIRKLNELHEDGIITEEEFEEKKKELLNRY